MAGQKIRMKVRQKDIADVQAVSLGVVQVLLDVALRVHDHRRPRLLIRDEVGGVCQAPKVVLFQKHRHLLYPSGTDIAMCTYSRTS